MSLTVLTGIDITGQTFPLAYGFITRESADACHFVHEALAKVIFHGISPASIVSGKFAKGLAKAMAEVRARAETAPTGEAGRTDEDTEEETWMKRREATADDSAGNSQQIVAVRMARCRGCQKNS